MRIRLASNKYYRHFIYRHIVYTKDLFHASFELYDIVHPDTFTLFNASFLGWAVVYTLFSLITSFFALLIINTLHKKKSQTKIKKPF
ncbi:DUF2651 family protein [Bacillus safensis]|uniref:DUF2651 family protein n=1 Tax=Bacillus safensis TaxID=561879 RepID=UPI0032E7FFEA